MRDCPLVTGLVSLLCCAATAAAQWIRNPTTGHYYCATAPLSWNDAEREARFLGGHLVTIEDRAENEWVMKRFGKLAPAADGGLWIGFTDRKKEGAFAWSSGSASTFTNWSVAQPDDHRGSEDFTHLWGPQVKVLMAEAGKWNDRPDLPARASGKGYPGVVEVEDLPSFALFVGRGCSSAGPVPWSAATARSRIGRTFGIRVSNLGVPVRGVNALGASVRRWRTMPRPFDARMIGSSECHFVLRWSAASPRFSRFGGMGEPQLRIPALPALVGAAFFVYSW